MYCNFLKDKMGEKWRKMGVKRYKVTVIVIGIPCQKHDQIIF